MQEYITINRDGHYLRVDSLEDELRFDGYGPGYQTIFRRIVLAAANQVALQWPPPPNPYYLAAEPRGAAKVWNRDVIGPWETFEEIRWPDDTFSLKTVHHTFLCAEGGGGFEAVADRVEAGPWERFYYGMVPEQLFPK